MKLAKVRKTGSFLSNERIIRLRQKHLNSRSIKRWRMNNVQCVSSALYKSTILLSKQGTKKSCLGVTKHYQVISVWYTDDCIITRTGFWAIAHPESKKNQQQQRCLDPPSTLHTAQAIAIENGVTEHQVLSITYLQCRKPDKRVVSFVVMCNKFQGSWRVSCIILPFFQVWKCVKCKHF